MLQESEIIPYHLSHPIGVRILILAPHPDDETFGCGGIIRLLTESKRHVKVIFLTSGDKADPSHPSSKIKHAEGHITDYSLMREEESVKALTVLGVSDYEFLRFPDRELYICHEKVLERLLEIIKVYTPDVIYSPSIIELNPDHRATAALSVEIRKRIPEHSTDMRNCPPIKIVFYEVTTPLRPNMLIDVTSVYGRKTKAMKKYKSQLRILDFAGYINALNRVRSLTVQDAGYVEAFWSIEHPFTDEYMERWLAYQSAM